MNKLTLEEKEVYKNELKELLRLCNMTIYTIITKVSKSGMSRHIKSFVIKNNEPYCIDWLISKVLDLKLCNDGVLVKGCGMDMGFELVYNLGASLWDTKEKAQAEKIITGRNGSKDYE